MPHAPAPVLQLVTRSVRHVHRRGVALRSEFAPPYGDGEQLRALHEATEERLARLQDRTVGQGTDVYGVEADAVEERRDDVARPRVIGGHGDSAAPGRSG